VRRPAFLKSFRDGVTRENAATERAWFKTRVCIDNATCGQYEQRSTPISTLAIGSLQKRRNTQRIVCFIHSKTQKNKRKKMSSLFLGFVFIVLGAIASSQWTVPLRYITSRTKWQWKHVYSVYGPSVVVLATLSAIVVARGMLFDIVAAIRLAVVFATLFFGFCWGIGVTITGFVVPRLGVAMTLTLNPSMVLIFGTLLPAFVFEPQVFSTFQGALIITSMVIVIAALLCALRANILRDRATERVEVLETETRRPMLFAGCALISGCLTSMSNLGWRIGRDSIRESAFTVAQCPQHFAPMIAWAIAFWGSNDSNRTDSCSFIVEKEQGRIIEQTELDCIEQIR
jgi:uncharacterized protein (DUF952 family)